MPVPLPWSTNVAPAGSGAAYRKFSHRKAVDFPLAGVAVRVSVDHGNGQCREARLALTGVGCAPLRVPEAEAILVGREIDGEVVSEAAKAAAKASHPVNNLHHGQPALRRKMVGILSQTAIRDAGNKAQTNGSKG